MEVLRETELGLATVLDELPDPVFIKDSAHRWVLVNPAFCALLHKRPDELLGKSDFDIFPPEEAAVFHAEDDRAFASDGVLENEEVLTDVSGDRHVIVTKKIAITGADGARYLIGIIRDLTDRRRVEARLARAEQLATIGALGASVAHEINNPLTSVSANLSFVREQLPQLEALLLGGASPAAVVAEIGAALADAEDGARRVARIVEDLRGLAKAEAGATASLPEAVGAAVRLVAGKARDHVAIGVDVPPDFPRVRGAEGRICQVLVNLLANAIQAFPAARPAGTANGGEETARGDAAARPPGTANGGEETARGEAAAAPSPAPRPTVGNQIGVSAWADANVAVVEVEDNGPGIAPETLRALQPRIHDPREPLPTSNETERGGLGLGLSISFALMNAIGGTMAFRSNRAGGTTVRLEFPWAEAEKSAKSPKVPENSAVEGALADAPRAKVLVVDDEEMILRLVKRTLAPEFDVRTADSFEAAVKLLGETDFDALISDVRMPGKTGVDLLHHVERALPELATHFLFVTGGAEAFADLLARSARPILQKPFSATELRQEVRALLGR